MSSDCTIKTPAWEVQSLVDQCSCYSCNMKTKEHSKKLREKIVEKYKKGDGSVKISNLLGIPQRSRKSIIQKWKDCGTCLNLPRTGHPHKLSDLAKEDW